MTHLNVAVRVRPLSEREAEVKAVPVVEIVNSNAVAITNLKVLENNAGDSRERVRRFSFDHCFDKSTTQEQVFEAVENVIGGAIRKRYHTCVLAYGQSSSGKTHTIMGVDDDPGLTPRLCESVFNYIREVDVEEEVKSITVSYLEIYNEKVKDLLSSDAHQKSLRVREHPSRGTYVQGLTHHAVNDTTALLEWLQTGNKKRRVSATSVNQRSSRSHSVFTITCFGGVKLTLVDLAGSERTGSRSFNNTSTFREGANINKSLVALGNVIFALADQSKSTRRRYVPYRDSVLTWLLKDTLGGNSKTVMIATISPSHTCYNETVNTLRFGHRAKQIIAQPISNEDPKQRTIRDLKAEVAQLKDLLLKQEIDPHLQFRAPGNSEISTIKTIDQSTNTEEPSLDENLQLTRKILDGLLEQIKAKLSDDFRWCKEELLRNSSGEGVFGEIIKNSFGKKLVCKEYSTNITQIYNVPEFKVFVYSDGKNIPGNIEGVGQNVLQSINGTHEGTPVAEVIEQRDPNIDNQGLTSIDPVGKGGPNVDEVDQNTLKVISKLEPSNTIVTNIKPVSEFVTNIDSVGQTSSKGSPSEISYNQGQLDNEDLIEIEQGCPYIAGENITIASIGQDFNNAASVKEVAATTQLTNNGISNIESTNNVVTRNADPPESCTSAVPDATNSQLVKEKVEKNKPKLVLNVSSPKKEIIINESDTSNGLVVQDVKKGDANGLLANQNATSTHLVDANKTGINQNRLKVIFDVDSSNKGGAVTQGITHINSVAQIIAKGGPTSAGLQLVTEKVDSNSPTSVSYVNSSKERATSTGLVSVSVTNIDSFVPDVTKCDTNAVLLNQGTTSIPLVKENIIKLDQSSPSTKKEIVQTGGNNNINLAAPIIAKGGPTSTSVNQDSEGLQLDSENSEEVDSGSPKIILYVNSSDKGGINTEKVSAGVTNINSLAPDVIKDDTNPVLVNQGNTRIQLVNQNVIKLDPICPKVIPYDDSPKKPIVETGLVNQSVTNINSVVQTIAKGAPTTERLRLVNEGAEKVDSSSPSVIPYANPSIVGGTNTELVSVGVTSINSLTPDVTKGDIYAPPVRQDSTNIQNAIKLDQSSPYVDLSKIGIVRARGITNVHQNITRSAINTKVTPDLDRVDLEGPKLNTAAKKLDLKVLRAATNKLIPVMDVSSVVSGSEKPVVKLRRTFSVCSADMESKKTKMYGSYETLSKYQQQPEPQLRKRSLDKSSSSVRNLKASTESIPEKVKSANDVAKTFSKVEARVDSIRKTPTKPRSEIVAAVTQRLYTKIKKKEVATETDDIIKEHKGTLARIRLQDITQRALRACRRRHAESQTETIPVLRVKETATDVQDLKIETVEMKHAHVSTREVITKDAAVNHTQDITFDQPPGQSLIMTKSCGVQVSASPSASSKEDQQHLLSFTKYLRAQKEPKIEVSHRATANPIYTSSVNINVSHNYINRKDSLSGDSLEDQNNTNAITLPTPDLISNHSSLEAEKASQVEALGVPQSCVVKEERCRSLPNYQPKMYKLRVTETKPHETTFSIEQPTTLKSIVKQSNDPDQSDCASDCSDNSTSHAFENVPDSLNYHFNKSVRFDEEPVNGRILEVMTNFLKEATSLMTNLAAAATNKFDADHAYDLQVTVSDAGGNIMNRKPRRRPRRRRPRKNETASQTCCSNYEHAVSQTSPKKTSEKSVETDGEVPENKYECLVRKACDRLERCADAISTEWYAPAQPEDSSMESNVTFSDYGSLPRQKLKCKPSCSPRAFLKELTSMRKQIIDSSREELVSENHQNCG